MDIKAESNHQYSGVVEFLTGAKYGSNAFGSFVASLLVPTFFVLLFSFMGHDLEGNGSSPDGSFFIVKVLYLSVFAAIVGIVGCISTRKEVENKGINTRLFFIYILLLGLCSTTLIMNPIVRVSEPVKSVQFIAKDKKSCRHSLNYKSKSLEYIYCAGNESDEIYSRTEKFFKSDKIPVGMEVVLTAKTFKGDVSMIGVEFIERINHVKK